VTDRVYWIEHKGQRILYYDWSNVLDTDQAVALVRDSAGLMRREPRGSVLVLTNVEGSRFNKRVLDAILELMNGNKPFVKASALVGLNGLMRAALGAMAKLTGRKLQAFTTADEAKGWLLEQQQATTPSEVARG
jgi:hypothetical protein